MSDSVRGVTGGIAATSIAASPVDERRVFEAQIQNKTAADAAAVGERVLGTDRIDTPVLSAEDLGKLDAIYAGVDQPERDLLSGMAKNGRLFSTDSSPGGDRRRTLDHLHDIATAPLADGVPRKALLSTTVRETAQPDAIDQGRKNTCTVTGLSYSLAAERPAEYARLVSGLASPEGRVAMASGDTLARDAKLEPDRSARSPSELLVQSALMEYGNGALDYDNQRDLHSDASKGLPGPSTKRVAEALFARPYDVYRSIEPHDMRIPSNSAALFGGIVKDGNGLRLEGHAVTPLRVQDGRFYFRDPKGSIPSSTPEFMTTLGLKYRSEHEVGPGGNDIRGLYSMSLDEFAAHGGVLIVPRP